MEPILPEPTPVENNALSRESSAQPPQVAQGGETRPNTAPEQSHEGVPVAASQSPAPMTNNQTPVTVPQPTQASADNNASTAAAPLIADDVDVIEKEWVDKAKKIVNATKDDPYTQEKEVSKLQADYLMKRYNKQIKLPE